MVPLGIGATAFTKSAGKNKGERMFLLYGIFSCAMSQATYCPTPSSDCLKHRKCSFGSTTFYDSALTNVSILTGCTMCNNQCGSCICENWNTSAIYKELQNGVYCSNSNYCKKPEVTYIMNYLVNNFNQCESQVLRIQPYLIQLCGTVNSICCNGACTQQSQITIPESMCDQNKGTPPFIRWMLTIYILVGVALWEIASIHDIQ
jgi:hypothetical protein